MRRFGFLLVSLLVAGCGGASTDLMPLEPGTTWQYHVYSGFRTYVEPVKVVRRVAVGNVSGYELEGPLGESRLAWQNRTLVAERLGVSRFEPPIPLLLNQPSGSAAWKGRLENLKGPAEATAELTQAPDTLVVGTQSFKTTKCTLDVEANGHKIELLTWFAPGTGIVRQDQSTDGHNDLTLERLSGP